MVKLVRNCQKIVKMLVRSCFLITLFKCLKGHKSLRSLGNVKSKSTLSESVSDKVTYFTAKKTGKIQVFKEMKTLFLSSKMSTLSKTYNTSLK